MLDQLTIQQIEQGSLQEALTLVADLFPGEVVFSSSLGQEDQVLTDVIFSNDINIRIFTIDTGRLFNETYELLDRTVARYKKPIAVFFPPAAETETWVAANGINGFYESVDLRKGCCHVRKVLPLNRALQGAKVWVTGLRADQSDNRKDMPVIEWMPEKQLYKFNPLIRWTYEEMITYINDNNVPYNRLHDKGFVSIGCAPCTRAIEPGEEPRAGRWWWEASHKECGLHVTAR
ncbi:MAG: phosphoadenylyl-sulfate reductase [Chitinophagaceae bacterium]|nr:phosphoadenylyl-sulfate reductase [Chitinophagaceae bacterium]